MPALGNFQKHFDFSTDTSLALSGEMDAKFELTQGLLAWQKTQKKARGFESAYA